MSTRSIIAFRLTDGSWRGRYAHSDGYPEYMNLALSRILSRDGWFTAVNNLCLYHRGWSYIDPTAEPGSRNLLGPDRAGIVPGYGLAYTDEEQADYWYLSTDPSDREWIDYVHVLEVDGTVTSFEVGDGATLRQVPASGEVVL